MTTNPETSALPVIACTLGGDELHQRVTDLAELGARALRTREQTAAGERLTFAAGPQVERELEAAIAAEAACCSFLTMALERRGDDELVLDISGPDEARPIIAAMFAEPA